MNFENVLCQLHIIMYIYTFFVPAYIYKSLPTQIYETMHVFIF